MGKYYCKIWYTKTRTDRKCEMEGGFTSSQKTLPTTATIRNRGNAFIGTEQNNIEIQTNKN